MAPRWGLLRVTEPRAPTESVFIRVHPWLRKIPDVFTKAKRSEALALHYGPVASTTRKPTSESGQFAKRKNREAERHSLLG